MQIRFHIDYVDFEIPRNIVETYLTDDADIPIEEVKKASDAMLLAMLNEEEDIRQSLYDDYGADAYCQISKVEVTPND